MKFDDLRSIIRESKTFKLNAKGEKLLQTYHKIITDLEGVLKPHIKDEGSLHNEVAVHIIAMLNSNKMWNEDIEIAARLDIMSSGGKISIDANKYVFNDNDKIKQYIEEQHG